MVSLTIGFVCLSLVVAIVCATETQQKPANNRINAPLTRSKGKDDCYKWCDEGGKGGSWGGGGGSWGGDDNGGHKGGHHKGGHKGSSSSSSSSESSDSSDDDDRKAHAQNRQAPVAPLHAKQRVANVTGHHQVAPAARKRINARAKIQHPVAHQERNKIQTAHQERKAPQKQQQH